MTNTIKGFFFDLDGTLVNTHEANFRAYKQAVQEVVGAEVGDELKDRIKLGESSRDFLPKLLRDISNEHIDAINNRKKEVYPAHLDASELNTFLSTFLEHMSENCVTALVTTAKRDNAEAVLKVHGIDDLFDFKIFGHDVREMKPNPEAYLLALSKSGLEAREVLAFEDSQKGIDAATAAGIATVHIRNFL